MGNYFGQRGDYSKAISSYQKAVEAINVIWKSTYLLTERINLSHSTEALFARLVFSCLRINKVEEAFNYTNLAKARVFLDMLGNRSDETIVNDRDPEHLALLDEERNIQVRLKY